MTLPIEAILPEMRAALRAGNRLVVEATPGAGKTTMMLKLADAVTRKGGVALFNTAEESLYQTSMTAQRLNLKNGFLCGNTDAVTKLLKESKAIIAKNPKKQFEDAEFR